MPLQAKRFLREDFQGLVLSKCRAANQRLQISWYKKDSSRGISKELRELDLKRRNVQLLPRHKFCSGSDDTPLALAYHDFSHIRGPMCAIKMAGSEVLVSETAILIGLISGLFMGGLVVAASYALSKYRSQTSSQLSERGFSPLKDALEKLSSSVNEIEKSRNFAHGELLALVKDLKATESQLKTETNQLKRALTSPNTRGSWGEMQLRRAVEFAGLLERCDFDVQVGTDQAGNQMRPDMVVHLPGGGQVVVDAKCPMKAYLDAVEESDDKLGEELLVAHSKQLLDHVKRLSGKKYWELFKDSPEFVVLFLPNESVFSSALSKMPDLIERSNSLKVLIATPTTLIALLKTISYGWQQQSLSENAQRIIDAGNELYKQLGQMSNYFNKLGRTLDLAVETFNISVNQLESKVMPAAKSFELFGQSKEPFQNTIAAKKARQISD